MPATNTRAKAIADEIAALRAERAELDAQLPDLEKDYLAVELPSANDARYHTAYQMRQQKHDIFKQTQSRAQDIDRKLRELDRAARYGAAGARADDDIKAARGALVTSLTIVPKLEATRGQLRAKLEERRSTVEAVQTSALDTERAAADCYAKSLVGGSDHDQRKALEELQAAQGAKVAADNSAAREAVVIAALQAQIDSLDTDIDSAKDRVTEARSALSAAMMAKFMARWDVLVEELSEVGACLVAAARHGRRSAYDFIPHDLELRSFEPVKPVIVTRDLLIRRADDVDFSDAFQ